MQLEEFVEKIKILDITHEDYQLNLPSEKEIMLFYPEEYNIISSYRAMDLSEKEIFQLMVSIELNDIFNSHKKNVLEALRSKILSLLQDHRIHILTSNSPSVLKKSKYNYYFPIKYDFEKLIEYKNLILESKMYAINLTIRNILKSYNILSSQETFNKNFKKIDSLLLQKGLFFNFLKRDSFTFNVFIKSDPLIINTSPFRDIFMLRLANDDISSIKTLFDEILIAKNRLDEENFLIQNSLENKSDNSDNFELVEKITTGREEYSFSYLFLLISICFPEKISTLKTSDKKSLIEKQLLKSNRVGKLEDNKNYKSRIFLIKKLPNLILRNLENSLGEFRP